MAGPSGRVKAICIVASLGHLLIYSLSKHLLLKLAAGMSEHIMFGTPSSLPLAAVIIRRTDPGSVFVYVTVIVLINFEGNHVEFIPKGQETSSDTKLFMSYEQPIEQL